jgi:hypothetical protein
MYFMETTQLRLYALLRDKNDGNEYEMYVRIHEEKLNLNNIPSTKDDISSLRREIMDTRSELKSTIYFTAMTQLLMIAFFFICIMIVLVSI